MNNLEHIKGILNDNTHFSKKIPQQTIHPPQIHPRSSHQLLRRRVLHGCSVLYQKAKQKARGK